MKKERDMLAFEPYNGKENIYVGNMISILSQYFDIVPYDVKKDSFGLIKKCKGIVLNWHEIKLNIYKCVMLGIYKLAGVRIIWVFHDMYPHRSKNMLIAWLKMQSMIFLSDTIILHSKSSRYCLQRYYKIRCEESCIYSAC